MSIAQSEMETIVRRCVEKCARKQSGALGVNSRLADDLGYDSLQFIELAVELEYAFGISLTKELRGRAVETVGDIERLVQDVVHENHGAR